MPDPHQPSAASDASVDSPGGGIAARRAANIIVKAALERRDGFDTALGPALSGLEPRDRGFARLLALTVLRRLGPIDALLEPRLKKPPPEAVMAILRLGVAQLLFIDMPPHAAVAATVAMTEKEARSFKGLVNAILRGLQRDAPPPPAPGLHAPPWLYARWKSAYGEAEADAISARIAGEPPTDLTPRDPLEAEALAQAVEGTVLPGGSVRTARRGDLVDWPDFAEGRWWVQDAAAAIPARLLAAQPGEDVLDLCAAPGGKTMQLAATGAAVVALDRSPARLKRLTENLARTGLNAEIVTAEGDRWEDERTFDAVLLDAPCSATGAFRRQPDVLWAASPVDIPRLAMVQARLLDAAARRVRPGGRLVYAVCSLEPEEGEAQGAAFLVRHPEFEAWPPDPGEAGTPLGAQTPEGGARIMPSLTEPLGGMDGFYVLRCRRRV